MKITPDMLKKLLAGADVEDESDAPSKSISAEDDCADEESGEDLIGMIEAILAKAKDAHSEEPDKADKPSPAAKVALEMLARIKGAK